MLVSLTLNNLALVAHHEINFDAHFNVITGETGAGKSLILDALSLCVGERADAGLVRHGANECDVFGEFDVADNAMVKQWFAIHDRPFEETLLIRRKVSLQGRSKSWINGVPASIGELKSLGAILVNIHSQHAGLELLKPQFVVSWLDDIGGLGKLAKETQLAYQTWQSLKKQAQELQNQSAMRADKMALLSTKLEDIAPLLAVNFEDVESEYDELSDLENLMQSAMQAVSSLDSDSDAPSVSGMLARAIKICDNHSDKSRVFGECSTLLTLAQEQIDDALSRLSDYAEQSLPDEQRLNELNELISLAHHLSNKYHAPINELIDEAAQWQAELDKLSSLPDSDTLSQQVEKACQDYKAVAKKLQQARENTAPQVCRALSEKLVLLALPNARCEFVFAPKTPEQYNAHGMFDVALMFSANVGMPLQALHKVASGGELSRIALVMQVMSAQALGEGDMTYPTLVFDEVDVGISGGTAQVVGEMLRSLGAYQQILAITHQAQVAAAAHRHILVQKEHGEQTSSALRVITGDDKVGELARMSGGVTITDATIAHVQGLIDDIAKKENSAQKPNTKTNKERN